MVTGGGDNHLRLWDVETGHLLQSFPPQLFNNQAINKIHNLSFSPDGKTLAIVQDEFIDLRDMETDTIRCRIGFPKVGISDRRVAFSPDGKTLVTGHFGHPQDILRFFDVEGGCSFLGGHQGLLSGNRFKEITFSPADRKRLMVLTEEGLEILSVEDITRPIHLTRFDVRGVGAFSPDGKMLATGLPALVSGGLEDSSLYVWNVNTRERIKTFEGGPVRSLVFSPDSTKLASEGGDGTVLLWALAPPTEPEPESLTADVNLPPHAAAVDTTKRGLPDGAKVRLGKGSIYEIAHSPNGSKFAVASSIGVWLYDAENGEELDLLSGHMDWVSSVAFSPDGKTLASGGASGGDSVIRLWNAHTGEHIRTLKGDPANIRSVAFSPDGKTLASGGDSVIRLWNAHTGEHIRTLKGGDRGPSQACRLVPMARLSQVGASTTPFGCGTPTRANTSAPSKGIRGPSQAWRLVPMARPSQVGATSPSGCGTPTRGNTSAPSKGILRSTLEASAWRLVPMARLSQVGVTNPSICGTPTRANTSAPSKGIRSVSLAWRLVPMAKTLASGSRDRSIRLWNAHTGEHIRTLEGHADWVFSVAFSPDGKTLASGSRDRSIRLWNAHTGEHIRTLEGHTGTVSSVAFSPNGKTLVSGSDDTTIYLWNAHTGEHIRTLEGHTGTVSSVAFSPNGKTLVSGSDDTTIYLWNAHTGEHIRTLEGHTGGGFLDWVFSVAFSPDGKTIANGDDYTIHLWNAHTGEHIRTLEADMGQVEIVLFSPDGKTIASGVGSTIQLWNVHTGEHIRTLKGHTNWVSSVSFSPDGNTIASGGSDGTVLLWNLAPAEDADEAAAGAAPDVNRDGEVNIQDLVAVAAALGQTGENDADVNGDGEVNIQDLVAVAAALGEVAAAPAALRQQGAAHLTQEEVQHWLTQAQQADLTDATSVRGIRYLEQLLAAFTPKEDGTTTELPKPVQPRDVDTVSVSNPRGCNTKDIRHPRARRAGFRLRASTPRHVSQSEPRSLLGRQKRCR